MGFLDIIDDQIPKFSTQIFIITCALPMHEKISFGDYMIFIVRWFVREIDHSK